MKPINFISCGLLGDFIHSLFAAKNLCDKAGAKSNIYITDKADIYGGGFWRMGIGRSYEDLSSLVASQPFVNKFEMLAEGFDEPYVNLNTWRNIPVGKNWSELLSCHYNFSIPKPYKWIGVDGVDPDTDGKIVIHRSSHRHNGDFDWSRIIDGIDEEIIFITCSDYEWQQFPFKQDKIKLNLVSTINEMAIAINSCRLFIGNQSAPFALASALDINRLVELHTSEDSTKYINEDKYSENISWYLSEHKKHFNEKSIIQF